MLYVKKISKIIKTIIHGFIIHPIIMTIGIACIIFSFYNPYYIIVKEKIAGLEFITIATEFFVLITAYFTFYKNLIKIRFDKNELSNLIANELLEVQSKLDNYSFNLIYYEEHVLKITESLFIKWIENYKNFEKISSDFIEVIDNVFFLKLDDGIRYFLQYTLYEIYIYARNDFILSLSNIDSTPGSAKYRFIQIFNHIITKNDKNIFQIDKLKELSTDEVEKKWKQISTGNIEFYAKNLKILDNQEALIMVAEQCIQKGYTSFNELLKLRDESQPFKMIIKYDERFTYVEQQIKNLLKPIGSEETIEMIIKEVENIISPYPFSEALNLYDDAIIKLLPRDPFLYVLDLRVINNKYKKKSAQSFMTSVVIPKAKTLHDNKIKKLIQTHELLGNFKKIFTANYYIIDIDVETLIVKADNQAIPAGFRKILLRDILENGQLANLLSSQDIYISSIINIMPFESLLFNNTFDSYVEKYYKKYSKKIKQQFKANNIQYLKLSDKSLLSKKINEKVDIIYSITKEEKQLPLFTKLVIKESLIQISVNAKLLLELLEKRGI